MIGRQTAHQRLQLGTFEVCQATIEAVGALRPCALTHLGVERRAICGASLRPRRAANTLFELNSDPAVEGAPHVAGQA